MAVWVCQGGDDRKVMRDLDDATGKRNVPCAVGVLKEANGIAKIWEGNVVVDDGKRL